MATDTATTQASEAPQQAWIRWQREHADVLEGATRSQQVLLEAAVRFVAVIAAQPILLRIAAYFLLHAQMGLTAAQVGAAVGRTTPGIDNPSPGWQQAMNQGAPTRSARSLMNPRNAANMRVQMPR
ncbi:hypothetical protein [Sorangium sp. So ce381]|uniref:hypothetical protein n=1 Tax=Sorangium sp. So ce381 TaxID=3133307 RepID=UPI003F5C3E2D